MARTDKKSQIRVEHKQSTPAAGQVRSIIQPVKLLEPAKIHGLFETLQQRNPHPQTELLYNGVFELLIAVVLSAQATDVSVNLATQKLFKVASTPQALLQLGEDGLKEYIRTIGLYNTKAKNIIALCQQLLDLHQGQVPASREALEALPGVGRKTANVILNTWFGQPVIAVDTHVFRVSNRMGLAQGTTVEQVEAGLESRVPAEFMQHAHHWLILHGRYTCTARQPKCDICPVRQLCPSSAAL